MARLRACAFARAAMGGAALSGLLIAAGGSAHAAAADSSAAASEGVTALGEVVVTAQKRSENLQKTPIAITAVTSDRIEQGNINQPVKLQFSVPSMTFGNEDGFTYLTLRGVGNDATSLAESSVATYQDGVYTAALITESIPSADLQRIEILRGPQGTLYGRNTTGGVINYITKSPSFDPGANASISYGNYNAVQGDIGVTGPVVQDKIAGRFSFHYGYHDGYYPNIATHVRDYQDRNISGRAAVLFQPTDHLTITVRGDMAHDTFNDAFALIHGTSLDGFTDAAHPLGLFSEPAAFFTAVPGLLSPSDIAKLNGGSIASYYGLLQPGPPPPDIFATRTVDNGAPTIFRTDANGASVTVSWDAGVATVKSISAYRYNNLYFENDSGGIGSPSVDFSPFIQRDTQYTEEINISGKGFNDRLDWLVGGFYYHDDGYLATTVFLPSAGEAANAGIFLSSPKGSPFAFNLIPAPLPTFNILAAPNNLATVVIDGANPYDGGFLTAEQSIPTTAFLGFLQRQTSESVAGFFQGTYRIVPQLRLTGGFRFTADSKTAYRELHSNLLYDLGLGSTLCNSTTSKSWTAPTGTVGIDYDAAPHVLTYAKASWGYKAGGMNPGECHHIYDPEYLTDYEGGIKAIFADGQILTNLAIYYYDYKNIQFTTYIQNASEILNAGSATAFGVELEYAIQPRALPGWSVDGSLSYEDSHYGTGCFGDPANLNNAGDLPSPLEACPATVINPATGLPVPIGPSASIKGNELIRAPKWKTNVGVQYNADLGSSGYLLTRFDAAWTDTIYNDIFNGKVPDLAQWTQPGYWILNARMTWTSPDKRYSAELFGDNLLDTIYATNRVAFNTPTSVYNLGGQLGPPRTFGVRLTVKLGSAAR